MIRKPAVAGMFYPGRREELIGQIDSFISKNSKRRSVIGAISPHAGYIYSGECAGKMFSKILLPDRVVILGVDHRGYGEKMSVDAHSEWETPIGKIKTDMEFIDKLIEKSSLFNANKSGNEEHSIEVQIPFIQYLNPDAKIVPIMVSTYDMSEISEGAQILSSLIRKEMGETLVLASTDMSHYISAQSAKEKDSKVIKKIMDLDPDGMMNIVFNENVSMCGVAPVYFMMKTVLALDAKKCEVVEYTNSGIASGDFDKVVGYMSAYIY